MKPHPAAPHPDRRWLYSLFPLAVLAVISLVVALYALRNGPPASVYRIAIPSTPPPALCPGERLTYEAHIEIVREPVVLQIVQSIWSIDQARTVVFDNMPFYAAYTTMRTIDRDLDYIVPPLLPGAYRLEIVAHETGTLATGIQVPFSIKHNCKQP